MLVAGVIKGWGRTHAGELGSRCEKARILALSASLEGIVPQVSRLGFYDAFERPQAALAQTPEERDRLEAWMAVIGDRLETMYPGVRVYEKVTAMQAKFPPDDSYELRPAPPRIP